MKICTKCNITKPITDFSVSNKKKGYLKSRCKKCCAESRRIYYKNNTDKVKSSVSQYRRKNKVKIKEMHKKWRADNIEHVRAERREWRKLNAKKVLLAQQRWRHKNPERIQLIRNTSRARRRNAEGHFTNEEWQELKNRHGNKCVCCKRKRKLTVDHIVPIFKGGSNWISNIQPLCLPCNDKKGTKEIKYA